MKRDEEEEEEEREEGEEEELVCLTYLCVQFSSIGRENLDC